MRTLQELARKAKEVSFKLEIEGYTVPEKAAIGMLIHDCATAVLTMEACKAGGAIKAIIVSGTAKGQQEDEGEHVRPR